MYGGIKGAVIDSNPINVVEFRADLFCECGQKRKIINRVLVHSPGSINRKASNVARTEPHNIIPANQRLLPWQHVPINLGVGLS